MDKTAKIEKFIDNWNATFEDCPLTTADLKSPHAIMKSLFLVYDRLGIDRDAILSPPPEDSRNESFPYYRDLLPVINTIRILNHILVNLPEMGVISISQILQPTPNAITSILWVMSNLSLFQEERLKEISEYEEELFAKSDQVKLLEEKKNKLRQLLNEQAEEKGKRAERLEKLDDDIEQLKEDEKNEKALREKSESELEALRKENHQTDVVVEQRRAQLQALEDELARKRAARVYDADDVRAQATRAARDVAHAERALAALRAALAHKDASLDNLQAAQPALCAAAALLHDIAAAAHSLKEMECGDLDSESKEGELETLNMEASELSAQLAELATARDSERRAAAAAAARRHAERQRALSSLREAEDTDRQCRERSKQALQRTEQLKALTVQHQQHKLQALQQLQLIKGVFTDELKSMEDTLMDKAREVEKRVEEKLRNRYI